MGIKERREREKLELREKILEAALEIILKEGFGSFSMRKLAERIEYSPASIYLHFKSREEIAQQLSEKGFRELFEQLTVAAAGKSASDAFRAVAHASVAFGLANPEIYRLIFMGDSDYMSAAFADENQDSVGVRTYGILLDVAQRLGVESTGLAATTFADLIWTTFHGIVSLRIACPGLRNTELDVLVDAAVDSLLRGLAPRI